MVNKEIKNFIEYAGKIGATVIKAAEPLANTLNSILNTITLFYDKYKKDNFTREEVKKNLKIYESYGTYGWSIPFNTELLLDNEPKDLKTADKKLIKYCNKKYIESCFSYILTSDLVNQYIFNEAKVCYQKKLYTSCILTLYSLIDSLMIKIQPPKTKGYRIINTSFEKINAEIENNNNKYLFYHCRFFATIHCMKTLFKQGDDFKIQPELPNRNFISHGMFARNITKLDCIKSFILLQNLCFMIKFLRIKLFN